MRRRPLPPTAVLVRVGAARAVDRVVRGGQNLDVALSASLDPSLSDRDRALAKAIAYAAVRWFPRLRWIIAALLRAPLRGGDRVIEALLACGIVQIRYMRVPDHAAVHATVEVVGTLERPSLRKLVNAVLRRYQREAAALENRADGDPEARWAHPAWLLERLEEDWPREKESILAANNAQPPMWLRVNCRRGDVASYRRLLAERSLAAEPQPLLPCGLLLARPLGTEQLPGFAEGLCSVQDGAAQLAAPFMDLAPGQRVLDACAAPGGKSAHMLELEPEIELHCVERDAGRAEQLQANLDRLGLSAAVTVADAAQTSTWWDGRPFDRILLDVPCSATGVIRRHPDIKLLRRAGDIDELCRGQRELLAAAWRMLAPGGRLLYCTCSVLRAENQRQTVWFLRQHGDAETLPLAGRQDYQNLPGAANMDGFYYCCLYKRAGVQP